MVLIIVIAIIIHLVFWFIRVANSKDINKNKKNVIVFLVFWFTRVANSIVDVYLAQRFVAINSMVDTIKGHTKAEKHILESVINTRTKELAATTLMKKMKQIINLLELYQNYLLYLKLIQI